MARRNKSEFIDRYYSGNPIEIVNGDIASFVCIEGKEQTFLWDVKVRGLAIRATPTGRKTFIVRKDIVTPEGRKQYKTQIGACDEISLEDARRKAEVLIRRCADLGMTPSEIEKHQKNELKQAEERERQRLELIEQAKTQQSNFTLAKLCEAYWTSLERQGKTSAGQARNTLTLHVITNHPDIAAKQANQVTRKDVTKILETMVNAGIGATTAKARACLVAAFNLAMRADGDVIAGENMRGFDIETNPAQATNAKPIRRMIKPGERTLSKAELHVFYKEVLALPSSSTRNALLLYLYTGGQRMAQILRAERTDYNKDEALLTLRDPKGNRDIPRLHVVPLVQEAVEIVETLDRLAEEEKNSALFFSTAKRGVLLDAETVGFEGNQIAKKMLAEGKARASFQLKDLRRTVETMLAAAGVHSDVRAQLQSHGLSGVQTRHYDKHSYLPEKRSALDTWLRILIEGNVKHGELVQRQNTEERVQ
jgi:integrase